jgi:uncharacterized membrane protein
MKSVSQSFLPKKKVLLLLSSAGWLLLGVSWVMSVYAYARLPQTMALWTSLWRGEAAWSEKSLIFFLYPLAQTVFFFLVLAAARILFFRKFSFEKKEPALEEDKKEQFADLKKEVVYLALIFINLIFIHLQTSLILLSHRIGHGLNRFYFYMLVGVILILIPYYYSRGKMILRG